MHVVQELLHDSGPGSCERQAQAPPAALHAHWLHVRLPALGQLAGSCVVGDADRLGHVVLHSPLAQKERQAVPAGAA